MSSERKLLDFFKVICEYFFWVIFKMLVFVLIELPKSPKHAYPLQDKKKSLRPFSELNCFSSSCWKLSQRRREQQWLLLIVLLFFYITGHLSVGEADTAYNWELNTLTWRIQSAKQLKGVASAALVIMKQVHQRGNKSGMALKLKATDISSFHIFPTECFFNVLSTVLYFFLNGGESHRFVFTPVNSVVFRFLYY